MAVILGKMTSGQRERERARVGVGIYIYNNKYIYITIYIIYTCILYLKRERKRERERESKAMEQVNHMFATRRNGARFGLRGLRPRPRAETWSWSSKERPLNPFSPGGRVSGEKGEGRRRLIYCF